MFRNFTLNMVAIMAVFFTQNTLAEEYSGALSVARVRVDPNGAFVGTNTQPGSTCSNWGEYFRFDHLSPHGKSLLAILLTAKVAGKTVEIWYTASSAPGTNQTNGCYDTTISTLTGVSIPN